LINRNLYSRILEYQEIFPVVAILGPRQCGKSTLANMLISGDDSFIYLDLEKNSDLNKLNDPELFFNNNRDRNICIDEIQLKPDLFQAMRPVIDEDRRNGRFIILGSASISLIRQSSESLAGRIGYLELTSFQFTELEKTPGFSLSKHWLRGGFPESYIQQSEEASIAWRENFIRSFVERDFPQLGLNIPPLTTRRLLSMCAHNQGQLINSSRLGESLGTSYHTIQKYLDLLEHLFILRSLRPYLPNISKRLIKSPKVYFRDSGLLHSMLDIENFNDLMGHPVFGFSWEGYCIETIVNHLYQWQAFFYRTSSGNEIDLILERGNQKIALEFKAASAPKPTKGLYQAMNELEIEKVWIIAQTEDSYPLNDRVEISNLGDFLDRVKN
jgi:predicted AAA+ superfamily ATPase